MTDVICEKVAFQRAGSGLIPIEAEQGLVPGFIPRNQKCLYRYQTKIILKQTKKINQNKISLAFF